MYILSICLLFFFLLVLKWRFQKCQFEPRNLLPPFLNFGFISIGIGIRFRGDSPIFLFAIGHCVVVVVVVVESSLEKWYQIGFISNSIWLIRLSDFVELSPDVCRVLLHDSRLMLRSILVIISRLRLLQRIWWLDFVFSSPSPSVPTCLKLDFILIESLTKKWFEGFSVSPTPSMRLCPTPPAPSCWRVKCDPVWLTLCWQLDWIRWVVHVASSCALCCGSDLLPLFPKAPFHSPLAHRLL